MTEHGRYVGPLRGLYAITDADCRPADELVTRVEAVVSAGAAVVQYRDKSDDRRRRKAEAAALAAVCRGRALFVVNDDIELAAAVGADGVHLGEDDASMAEARRRLGEHAVVGVSCYNDLQRARAAQEQGASYVAFGSVYPSPTKPAARRADTALLVAAKECLQVPVVAIGGITPDNAPPLVEAGVDMVAVISGVFAAPDPAAAARAIGDLFH